MVVFHPTKTRKKRARQRPSTRSARAQRRPLVAPLGLAGGNPQPVFTSPPTHVAVDQRADLTSYGPLADVHELGHRLRLADRIDDELRLFKRHQPYWESDHVLIQAYNLFVGGSCLDDIEALRNSRAVRRILGAESIPDPTTAGDFLRRFGRSDLAALQRAIDAARVEVWRKLPARRRRRAVIDLDSTIVPLSGQCQEGADFSYTGQWSYHPLLITLAETNEVLRTCNRPGNAPSADGSGPLLEEALSLVGGHFSKVFVRGDSKFYRQELIESAEGRGAQFAFVLENFAGIVESANQLPENAWKSFALRKRSAKTRSGKQRRKRPRRRGQAAARRRYKNLETLEQAVAELEHQPSWANRSYRVVVRREYIQAIKGQELLFDDFRYRFIITNIPKYQMSARALVRFAYGRCDQENIIEQLKNGLLGLKTPTGELLANDAFLMMGQLAWCLRSWWSLLALPAETLRWEWKRFRQAYVYVAARITHSGGRVRVFLAAGCRWLGDLLRSAARIRQLCFS